MFKDKIHFHIFAALFWLKLEFAKLTKNKKAIIGLVFMILIFALPLSGQAVLKEAALTVLGVIATMILYFLALIILLAGIIMDLVLGHALNVQNAEVVEAGWTIARDVANMFFVIFLLVIAFATIFRIEEYQYKILLPKLILGVLLVNFSRTIATIFIEFSNLLTAAFLNFDPSRSATSALLALMGVDDIFKVPNDYVFTGKYDETMLISMLGIIFIFGLLALTLAGFAGMLVIRTIALLVLIVMSPLAFGLGILPATKKVAEEWWENFIKYTLYTPLAAFALYLAMKVASEMKGGSFIGYDTKSCLQSDEYCLAVQGAASQSALPVAYGSSPESFYGFALIIGLLFFSFLTIQKVGGALAGFLIGAAKAGMLGAGAFFGKGALKRADRWLAKGEKPGLTRRWLKKGAEALGTKGGLLGSIGKGLGGIEKGLGTVGRSTKYLSPTILSREWKKRQDEADYRAYGVSGGAVRKTMNSVFQDEDKTDYKKIAQMEEVDRRKKMYHAANPGGEYSYYIPEMIKAAQDGRKEDFGALIELLEESNNGNEGIQRLIQHPEWKKNQTKFFSGDYLNKHTGARKTAQEGGEIDYNAETMRDMAIHTLGDEMAQMIGCRLSAVGMEKGNWSSWVGSVDTDLKTGKTKWRKLAERDTNGDVIGDCRGAQEEEAAGQLAKRGEAALNKAFRSTYADLTYVGQSDGTVKEAYKKASPVMQIFARDWGAPPETAERIGRNTGSLNQAAVAAVSDQIERHLGKGKAKKAPTEELRKWLDACRTGKKGTRSTP